MLRVSDILRHKGFSVVTVEPSLIVLDLIALLATHGIGAAVVSSDGVHADGIVSERDVVRALAAQGADALGMTVDEVCTREVETADPSDPLDRIMAVMTERRFRHLPVVVDGRLHGLVSIGDVVKARVGELEMEQTALTTYITTGR